MTTYLYLVPNCNSVFSILVFSGPNDFKRENGTQLMVTFTPVAHGPNANAFTIKAGSLPNNVSNPNRIIFAFRLRSVLPRTQFVAVPLEPEDSSKMILRSGICPSKQRLSISNFLM